MGPRTCDNTLERKGKTKSVRTSLIEAVWKLVIPKVHWTVCGAGFVKPELLESLKMEALISNTVPKINFLKIRWLQNVNWANS